MKLFPLILLSFSFLALADGPKRSTEILEIDPELEQQLEREAIRKKQEEAWIEIERRKQQEFAEKKKADQILLKARKKEQQRLEAEAAATKKAQWEKEEARRKEVEKIVEELKEVAGKNKKIIEGSPVPEAETKSDGQKSSGPKVPPSGSGGRGEGRGKVSERKSPPAGAKPVKNCAHQGLDKSLGYFKDSQTFIITAKKICLSALKECKNPRRGEGGINCIWGKSSIHSGPPRRKIPKVMLTD